MHIHLAGLSDRGRKRERNDDHYCVGPFVEQGAQTALTLDTASTQFRQYGVLAAVADGMGGYAGGGTASRMVLETLCALYYGERRDGATAAELRAQVADYLAQTAALLRSTLDETPEIADAGTTLSGLAMLAPDLLVLFHIGDTRVMRYCAGYLRMLTVDHTPYGAAVVAGKMSETEAAHQPQMAGLLRSLGRATAADFDIDDEMTLFPGDLFLLGSDGWHGLGRGISRDEVKQLAQATPDPAQLARHMIRRAVETDGQDNATVVVVRCDEGETPDV